MSGVMVGGLTAAWTVARVSASMGSCLQRAASYRNTTEGEASYSLIVTRIGAKYISHESFSPNTKHFMCVPNQSKSSGSHYCSFSGESLPGISHFLTFTKLMRNSASIYLRTLKVGTVPPIQVFKYPSHVKVSRHFLKDKAIFIPGAQTKSKSIKAAELLWPSKYILVFATNRPIKLGSYRVRLSIKS